MNPELTRILSRAPATARPASVEPSPIHLAAARARAMTAAVKRSTRPGYHLLAPSSAVPPAGGKAYSLQMAVSSSYDTSKLPMAAFFVPLDERIPCAMVDTDQTFPPNHRLLSCIRLPVANTRDAELTPALAALEKRFVAHHAPPHAPLEVTVREVSTLTSIERTPQNVDHDNNTSRQLELDVTRRALTELETRQTLRPGVPYSLTAVGLPSADASTSVLFVPDDPRLPVRESVGNASNMESERRMEFFSVPREVRGEWELYGQFKRKRAVVEDEEDGDGERAAKRPRAAPTQERNTITVRSAPPKDYIWKRGTLEVRPRLF